jgi:hypothetical protein
VYRQQQPAAERTLWSITSDIGVLPVCGCVPSTKRCEPAQNNQAQHMKLVVSQQL